METPIHLTRFAMKIVICLLACLLAWPDTSRAQDTEEITPADPCSARYSTAPAADRVAAMRMPVKQAIATLDNASVAMPSPSLASGNINYITITPNFATQLDNVCVLGYFSLLSNGMQSTIPLRIDHIEVVKTPNPNDAANPHQSTRIHFYTPRMADFENGRDLDHTWKFWQRNQHVLLRLAAFEYHNGQRGPAYFGYDLRLTLSAKSPSVMAALLFAGVFYLLAATTVPSGFRSDQGRLRNGWRSMSRRLMPWHITGAGGTASLSQLQMLLFTLIVATLLFYQWLRTGLLQELSTDLLYLIGLSTAGAAGTQLTANIKKELDPACYAYAQQLGWFNAPPAGVNRKATPGELLMTNKRFDIYKFQMLVFTFVIAAYVIASGADQLGNLQISATLLTLMGMSQGAYVGGRAAGDSMAPLQDQLRGMQNLQQRYLEANAPDIATDLQDRFTVAARQASMLFNNSFARAVPEALLRMPPDLQKATGGESLDPPPVTA
jgi:hypothetical protein